MLRKSFFQKLKLFLAENDNTAIQYPVKGENEESSRSGGRIGDKLLSFIGLEEAEENSQDLCDSDLELDAFVHENKDVAFSEKLFLYIDKKMMIDTSVYKKAGIDRRHFSKIRSKDYHPGKGTALLLGLALELNLNEMKEFLGSAGYSLSKSDTADLIVKFCIINRVYDVTDVNLALDRFGQKTLGEMK